MRWDLQELNVLYQGWGEHWKLGTLLDTGQNLVFEYSREALEKRLELSPLHLKLRPAGYGNFPHYLHRLPGLVYDSLPDGWGMLLMDRFLRQRGIRNASPLERLAFLGDRTLGALSFVPTHPDGLVEPDWDLPTLSEQSARALENDAETLLDALAIVGGSPQGARPKALVQYDLATNRISTHARAQGNPWLVKFPAKDEHPESCTIEQLYMTMARECGIEVPSSRVFELPGGRAAFGVERFDRTFRAGVWHRVPVHSLAGLLQIDFRVPGATDYTALLRATRLMTRDAREVEKAYARAVFNVVFHNRDDHPKNFAWILGQDQRWKVSPAFDLTFSEGPRGQHSMDICGAGDQVTMSHLLRLAEEGGVSPQTAKHVVERIRAIADTFPRRVLDLPIRPKVARELAQRIQQCKAGLS